MNRRRLSAWAFSLLLPAIAFISGCGGSGAGGAVVVPPGGDDHTALLTEIETKFASFNGSDPDAEDQQMLTFLQSKPEFEEAGIADTGGAWARFKDGTTVVIANNVGPSPELPVINASRARPKVAPNNLPTSGDVLVGTAMGDAFMEGNQDIADMFTAQPYTALTGLPTVDQLKTFNNLGVLYLTTHGCIAPIVKNGPKMFIAWTATKRVKPPTGTPDAYASDLREGNLTYFVAKSFYVVGDTAQTKIETHYGFTSKFVKKYWTGKFNKNSFVFMNTCSSAKIGALEFELACLQAGASAYVGWTDTMVIADGIISAAYLFDRLLGLNSFDPEDPPQRSFGYMAVLAEMSKRKRLNKTTKYDETLNPKTGKIAKLQMMTLGGPFTQLAPSIEGLFVDEQKDELTIAGVFGAGKGDVTINDHPLTIKKWTANQIVCAIPRKGGDASGDVQVTAAIPRQFSNIVQLTEWRGNVTCTFEGKDSLMQVMEFAVHFRTDVHKRRIQPHQDPFRPISNYLQARDTRGTFTVSGTYTSPDRIVTESWSGGGDIPSFIKPPDGTSPPEVSNVIVEGSFDENRQFSMAVRAVAKGGNTVRHITRDVDGKVTSDKTTVEDVNWLSVDDLNGNFFLLTANSDYTIPGGTRTRQISPEESMTLKWTTMQANHPPAPGAAR